jgi:hypothetical protein
MATKHSLSPPDCAAFRFGRCDDPHIRGAVRAGRAAGELPLGSTVTLQIQKSGERPVMQVPLAALYDAGKGPGVWRISARPTKVVWQPVKVLSVGAEAVQVTGDLRRARRLWR